MPFSLDSERLEKDTILSRQKEIRHIFDSGKRIKTQFINIYYIKSPTEQVGFFVNKKSGNSPERNRYKRWMREIYRQNKSLFVGLKLIFYVHKPLNISYHDLAKDILNVTFE